VSFFFIAFLSALWRWTHLSDIEVFARMVDSLFSMAKLSVEVMILLFGTLTLWLGFLKIAEHAGLVEKIAVWLSPLFRRLMPEVPKKHPAVGLITMNFIANGLGLDNAATPIGLKAMRSLQSLNPTPKIASNAQILFLVMNIFLPILLATSASTIAGFFSVAFTQRIKMNDPVVLTWMLTIAILLSAFIFFLSHLSAAVLGVFSSFLGNAVLFGLIITFLMIGVLKRVPVYESFIEGAKEGFDVSKNLLPYLVAMLCAVGVLRASGALDFTLDMIRFLAYNFDWDTRFVDALPTALVKPFSGSAARAMLIDTMTTHGVDSFPSLLAATVQGSTETTFYVLAVYFGAVGIQRTRHAIPCALFADLIGILASIGVCYWFFG